MEKIKFMRFILYVVILGAFVSGCKPKDQNNCGFVQNVYGERIVWKTKDLIPLYISSSIPEKLRPAIYRAVKTWESHVGRSLFQIIENNGAVGSNPKKDGINGIYFLNQWESDKKSEQGRTSVYWAADQIMEADIRINAEDFSFYDLDKNDIIYSSNTVRAYSGSDAYSFEALVLHELGHFLGLKHTDAKGSVMVTHLRAFEDRTQVSEVDSASVQCAYN